MNITINRNDAGAFFVLLGDRFQDQLTYEEMLGVVAQATMPANPRALTWLKTASEWRDEERQMVARLPGDGSAFGEVWGVPTDGPRTVPPTASELREQTIAAAVAQDGVDARVVGDWASVGDGAATVFEPIRRQDVVLQVGDVVEFNDGLTGTVRRVDYGDQPCWTDGAYCTTLGGIAIGTTGEVARVVSINGRPIIED